MKASDTDNLIANGDFSAGLTDWEISSVSGSPSADSGEAVLPSLATISQTVGITAGNTYSFSYEMDLENDATGYVSVTSLPSNTTLFSASVSGNQSAISLIPNDPNDINMLITFDCTRGGELHADNVVLVAAEQGVLVGGDFTDADLPGWVKSGSGSMPSATGGQMKLPAGSAAYQDIAIAEGALPELSYSMTFSDGAAGTFTVTSLPSKTVLYTNSQALSDAVIHFSLSEGDTVARLTFSCSSGEVNVSPLTMGYTDADTIITEDPLLGHDIPWIFPGQQADITFFIQAKNPDQSQSHIHFTATDGFSLIDATIPGHEQDCSFEAVDYDDSGNTIEAQLTLNTGLTDWSICTLTLLVLDTTNPYESFKAGEIQYVVNGAVVGEATDINIVTASENIWDNVQGVSNCVIAMDNGDGSMSSQATLFVNYAPDGTTDGDGNPVINAHAIPVFVGIDFTLHNPDYPGPTADDITLGDVLTLINSIGATVEKYLEITGSSTFLQPYNTQSTSDTSTLTEVDFTVELPPFNIWCKSMPVGEIELCFTLTAPRTGGNYVFSSGTGGMSILTINFLANKSYSNPDPNAAADSKHIVITRTDDPNYLTFSASGAAHYQDDAHMVIFNISIDEGKEQGKYQFAFAQTVEMVFEYPTSVNVDKYGTVNAVWVTEVDYNVQDNYYPQFLLLPGRNINVKGKVDLTEDSVYGDPDNGYLVGYVAEHEDVGWESGRAIKGVDPTTSTISNVYPKNTIGFVRFRNKIEHGTDDVSFTGNDSLQPDGSSRMHLIDNFGNHILMTPVFNDNNDANYATMTVTVDN